MPAENYTTFKSVAPLNTHWRFGTCEEFECDDYLYGFRTMVDERTEVGQHQAYYIRHDKSRRHTEQKLENGLTVFLFQPGQRGFGEGHKHKVRTGRPSRLLVVGGDWRGNPRGEFREFNRSEDWVDLFANHTTKLKEAFDRG